MSLEIEEACTCGPAAWESRSVVMLLCFVFVVRRHVIMSYWLNWIFFNYCLCFWIFVKLKGYPAFETFNEVMTFQLLFEFNYLFCTTRTESRDFK